VRDAGVTEQAFQIALRNRAEIAVENRDAENDDEQIRPMRGHARHGGEQARARAKTNPAALEPMARKNAVVGVGAP